MSSSLWNTPRRLASLLMTGGLAAVGGWVLTAGSADAPNRAVAQDNAAQKEDAQYVGIEGCIDCHSQKLPTRETLSNPLLAVRRRDFCTLDEVQIFGTSDKHRDAFKLLSGEVGERMQKILGYNVTEDKRCLACHANWQWKQGLEKPTFFEIGVTCESCHGPASKWLGPHVDVNWRKKSPVEKSDDYAFIDVRNPIDRARQCFSCHIGNVNEGKVVTHEMYAAGHPPLPSIEMEQFISQMPPHWRTLREKGDFANRADYLKVNFPDQEHPEEDLIRTKSTLVSGIMALRESLNLFGEQAVDKHEWSVWPELAVFDCSACHHDLRAKSWRRDRGYGSSIPGRPQFFSWPTALVKIAVRHRAGDDDQAFQAQWKEFDANLDVLRRVLDRQPFGNPQQIHAVTHGTAEKPGLVPWLDQLAEDVFKSDVREADAKRALRTLVSLDKSQYPDFHAARMMMWAFRTIQAELVTPYPEFVPAAEKETLTKSAQRGMQNLVIFREWQEGPKQEGYGQVDELLGKQNFTENLRLKLPAGVEYEITKELPQALDAVAEYDPDWFREQLAKLAKEIPGD